MKIISKRQAMAIYRQYPQSRLFPFCTGKYNGLAASATTPDRRFRISAVCSRSSLNAVRAATAPMSYYAASR